MFYPGDSLTRVGEQEIRSVHGRLLNNLGELAYRKIIQSKIAIKNAPGNHVYTYYIIFFLQHGIMAHNI